MPPVPSNPAPAAGREAALQAYELSILNALREVSDALISATKSAESYEALARRVDALREYARLSYLRFENGAASYIEALYANSQLFDAELVAVENRVQSLASLVDVCKAIGGERG